MIAFMAAMLFLKLNKINFLQLIIYLKHNFLRKFTLKYIL